MNPTTLKPIHFGRAADRRVCVSPSWLSNGHWAITRALVKNSAQYETEASAQATAQAQRAVVMTDEQIARVVTVTDTAVPFVATGIFLEGERVPLARIFLSATGQIAAVDAAYCTLLGLTAGCTLVGDPSGEGVLVDNREAPMLGVMPIRRSVVDAHRTTLAALGQALAKTTSQKPPG